jgi:hypothetical protein
MNNYVFTERNKDTQAVNSALGIHWVCDNHGVHVNGLWSYAVRIAILVVKEVCCIYDPHRMK